MSSCVGLGRWLLMFFVLFQFLIQFSRCHARWCGHPVIYYIIYIVEIFLVLVFIGTQLSTVSRVDIN